MPQSPQAAYYHYDQNLGDPKARFIRAGDTRPGATTPEVGAYFVATVEGETLISTMWGHRRVRWRAEPGTPCVILGYWEDGTVQVRWPAIVGAYRVEGRFPAWTVAEDPEAKMAGGGHVLAANDLPVHRSPWKRLARFLRRKLEVPE